MSVPPNGAISPWRRFAVRLLAVCVLGMLTGAGWLVLQPRIDRPLTSYGQRVLNAGQLLGQAQAAMARQVRDRNGSRGAGARCYYATDPAASAPATSRTGDDSSTSDDDLPVAVGDRMFCGPVLFVDGDAARPYLTYNLVASPATSGIRLALSGPDGEADSPDPRPASQLVRPDGKLPPSRGRLNPPRPPAAVGDVLSTTSTLRTPLTPAGAQMVGRLSGVRLVEYGLVDGYDWGDRARTAPSGYRLLAFATNAEPGEDGEQTPDLSVRVDGVERGPLASTSDYVVTAVPEHARSVDLVLTDSGLKQSISLLTGKPESTNPQVTVRTHTEQTLAVSKAIRVRLTTKAGSGQLGGTLTVQAVSLTYWGSDGTPCQSPDRAWLHVRATVRFDGDRQAYGVESALISVTLPEAGKLDAHNAAADPSRQVDDVVDVPASLSAGSLTYAGTVKTAKATVTVLTPVTIGFDIPAG
ncbi:MAG: hypothetical protein ACR2N4_09560 [Jatrophihabitans sp.]